MSIIATSSRAVQDRAGRDAAGLPGFAKDAASDLMKTSHWTWESSRSACPGARNSGQSIGRTSQINNFCIGAQGNENKLPPAMRATDGRAGVPNSRNTRTWDCLACHAEPGAVRQGCGATRRRRWTLLAAAEACAPPRARTAAKCHFDGGGGNGVKHGDLDQNLYFPGRSLDVPAWAAAS